jgi:Zn finger protein HypA/HybF involved in hydrogenase expression
MLGLPWFGDKKALAMKKPLPHIQNSISFVIAGILLLASPSYAKTANNSQGSKTTNPHGALAIGCNNCHTTESWKPIRPFPDFDHRKTRFSLQGAHARSNCRDCHVQLAFSSAGTACTDCHADIHRRKLGSNCEQCHSVRGWRTIAAAVNGHENRFPLFGAHAALQCEVCHKSAAVSQYRGLSSECGSCHISEFRTAKQIDHQAAGFSTRCNQCHSADSWVQGFNHAQTTGFALMGAHASVDCMKCHAGGRFSGTPVNCVGCHLQEFNTATNPNHIASGFPQDCSVCHSTSAWIPASFNHNATSFPLTGAHARQGCTACHVNGQFANLPTACVSCHKKDYDSTSNPNHAGAGFPQDCAICHTTSAWTPASFDHSKTKFPLTGAHTSVACLNCHISGVYAGTPADCYSCHSKEYNSATNPGHAAAGFPKDCSQCHSTSSWSGAVFNHTKFPIYSGSHAGQWTACGDCHTNSSNYTVFSCLNCHAHEKAEMDSEHGGIRNYVYNSANCYSCHPNGRGGD